jgi:hypothetical protein
MPYQDSDITGRKVSLKNSSTAAEPKPTLVNGELALNSADNVLYHRDGQFPGAVGFKQIVALSQTTYDGLIATTATNSTTLYIVTADPA